MNTPAIGLTLHYGCLGPCADEIVQPDRSRCFPIHRCCSERRPRASKANTSRYMQKASMHTRVKETNITSWDVLYKQTHVLLEHCRVLLKWLNLKHVETNARYMYINIYISIYFNFKCIKTDRLKPSMWHRTPADWTVKASSQMVPHVLLCRISTRPLFIVPPTKRTDTATCKDVVKR